MKTRYYVLTLLTLVFAAVGLLAQMGPGSMMQTPDEIEFISKPSPTARVNSPYLYTAKAVAFDSTGKIDSSAILNYHGWYYFMLSMRMAMDTLPMDSVTGVVNWTPTVKGWSNIVIVATSNHGGRERQEFEVLVSGGSGTIQGRVTDTLTQGIPNIIVQAMKTDSTPIPLVGDDDHDGGFFSYSAKTDSNGYYTIKHVEPGMYKLRAISTTPNFASQWYDGQTSAALANVVTVADSSTLIADFVLRAGPARLPKFSVSGSVTDTLGAALKTGNPRVFFVRAGFALNANTSLDDFRESFEDDQDMDFKMDGLSLNVFSAKVDTLGEYSLKVPMGNYIAFVRAEGFVTTFFQNQTDITSANVIAVTKDTANINFTLAPLPPVVYGSISGAVLDTAKGIGVRARVIAFRDHWRDRDDFNVARTYMTDTDSTGAYSFAKLLPGNYFIFAVPLGDYAPAYYTNDTSTTHWKRATKLAVNGNAFTGINIYVKQLSAGLHGYAGITGSVNAGAQGSVAGAIVYASMNGVVSGYAMTGSNGNYTINGLAPGTYSVTVDRPGYEEVAAQTTTVSYINGTTNTGTKTSTPTIQTVNFSVSGTTGVTTPSPTGVALSYTLNQNYPNPFNPSTTITFAIPQSAKTTLKVYNILGQEVASLVDGYETNGVHQVLFNADRLSSGVYFYQLKSGSFVQSKKMVLLK